MLGAEFGSAPLSTVQKGPHNQGKHHHYTAWSSPSSFVRCWSSTASFTP